jgi:hypothetical protein
MRRFIFALIMLGCTPSPEDVCDHWAKLRKGNDFDTKKCVSKLETAKSTNPTAYKCEAKCVMKATEISEAGMCREVCN